MSAVKFNYPTYKLFEPQYHPQRPIIIDAEAVESPETVTLRYEEEAAARANGGDLHGDSPPGLLAIESCPKPQPPEMHSFESPRSYQDTQYPYAGQPFAAQQSVNAAAAQLNHLAFTANSSAGQYMSSVVPTVTSYQPTSGVYGTKFVIKLSAPYDLIAVTSQFFLGFGSHKCPAHAIRDASDNSGFGYVVSGDVPRLENTRVPSSNVPVSLLVEGADGQTLASIEVGTFTYHDTQPVGAEGPHEDVTRRPSSKSPEEEQQRTNPSKHQAETDHLVDATPSATNTYGYAPSSHQAVAPSYDATGYHTNSTNSMLSTYQRPSYGSDYPRPPPLLKTPSWSYAPSLSSPRSPAGIHHATSISRPNVTALPIPTSSSPEFVRTSTLQATTGGGGHGSMNPYALYSTKAVLKINGDLESMASNWTQEECDNGRRLVLFSKKQQGSTLSTTFKPVSASERPPNSICISCIYWAEKRECFVTSVDAISLLEQLVVAPKKFNVEEKNRIRRNIEGFRPQTVSKAKPESEEFFKIIMGFPSPKPRNIEKDIKVFPWKILAPALKKIVSKYSASLSPSSSHHHPAPSFHPTSGPPALLTPVSSTSPGIYGAPPTPTIADPIYPHHDSQTMASPRSLPGAPSSWGPYTGRTLSPNLKPHSPSIRMPSLPSYSHHSGNSYGMASHNHRWDTSNGYGDVSTASPYASHPQANHVYGTGSYGSGGDHRE
ncbi:hypothetical protein GGS21DRAFT_367938 [Xylaria nigripes]|nr:hypothetical protein GGS21DRAFT_367938 [Xylaria nigripes]